MSRPMVRIHDIESNEIIDREMNDEEFSKYQARELEKQAEQAETEAKATAKAALLERLGITQDEANLLLS
jgi:hypothetical protein